MIHTLAKRMASVFVSCGIAESEDMDIYTYACELILSTAINLIICIFISVMFGRLLEGILFIVCFAGLRHFAGGHHAKHHWGCILTFSIILTVSLAIVSILPMTLYASVCITISLISGFVIFALAPVEHENKPVSSKNRSLLKRKSRVIEFGLSVIVIVGVLLSPSSLFLAISLSMASVCGSMAYATLIKTKEMRKGQNETQKRREVLD